jgi:hypothetical protein
MLLSLLFALVEGEDDSQVIESSALDPPAVVNGRPMKKATKAAKRAQVREQMRAEYDFTSGVRGKYAARFAEGTNLVLLAPDVAARNFQRRSPSTRRCAQ